MGFLASQFQSRVARRLFLEWVCMLFLPLVALAFLGLRQASRQLEAQAQIHLSLAVKDASMSLLERVQACELAVELLLGDYASTGSLQDSRANKQLYEQLTRSFKRLALHHTGGKLEIIGAAPALPELAPAERELLAKGMLTLVLRNDGGEVRLLALRDLEAFGLGAGTLVGELEVAALLPVEGAQNLALVKEGLVLYTTNPEVFTPQMLAVTQNEIGAWTRLETTQGSFFAAAREVFMRPQYGIVLTLVMGEQEERVLAPIRHFRTLFLLTALLGFLLVFFVGLKRVQKNLAPVALLQEATRKVAGGDLDSRLDIRTQDEFQELGAAFNGMTDRVRERTRQLIEADAAKGRFLANMSHEIRTPMSSILGYTDLALGLQQTQGELRECLEVIQASGKHLLRIINDVLDISRIEAGKLQVELRSCSPSAVLNEAVRMVEPQVRAKGLALELRVRGAIPAGIQTDPDRLRQVLVNLLGNAAKFTERGSITVTVELRSDAGSPRLAFEIADSGPGIAPGQLQRLFQPFTQLDESMSRQHGGTGLGLSIAHALTRLLGGDLRCDSLVGHGSTFTATIDPGPLLCTAEPQPPLPAAKEVVGPSPLPRVPLLVAEDVRVNRALLTNYMTRAGFLVQEAENGREAMDQVLAAWRRGEPFALVLMDMQMPVMDGYEAVRNLRRAGYDGAIVALTAHAIGNERERILAAGCDDIATKPIDRARLMDLVSRSLRVPSGRPAAVGEPPRQPEARSRQETT